MPFREFVLLTRTACRLELHDLIRYDTTIQVLPMAKVDDLPVDELVQRMLALPDEYLHILLLHFGCGIPYNEINKLLNIKQAVGTASFALQILSYGLNLSVPPSDCVLQAASASIITEMQGKEKMLPSGQCQKRMSDLLNNGGVPQTPAKRLPLRTVVVAAIIAALILALTAAAVAALIRNNFRWVITPTDDGILVEMNDVLREPTDEDYEEMRLYQPAVLPTGFAYAYTDDREIYYLIDYYHNEKGQRIILWKTLARSNGLAFGIHSDELESFERVEMDGTTYLYYENSTHGRGVIHWEIDGFAFMLVTPFERDEALEIARSIEI